MISITTALKNAFNAGGIEVARLTITPTSGDSITVDQSRIRSGGLVWDRYSSNDRFSFGTATAAQIDISIRNDDGIYDDFIFDGAEIYAEIGHAVNGVNTYMALGYFTVDNSPRHLSTINITALDRMVMFDKETDDLAITYPCTVSELYNALFSACNVTCDTTISTLPNSDYTIGAEPEIRGAPTCRNYLQWLNTITGVCAQFGNNGHLKLTRYEAHTPGGGSAYVQNGILYLAEGSVSNSVLSGINGSMSGDVLTINSSASDAEQLTASKRYSSDIYDEVTITGISIVSGESEFISGEEGYILSIKDNPLIQDGAAELADELFSNYWLTFSPFTATTIPMPYLEPCDVIEFVDKDGVAHTSYITHITYVLNGGCVLRGSGESKVENGWATADPLTTREQEIVKQIAKNIIGTELGSYESAVIDLNNLIANALGLYNLSITNDDGSTTYYFGNAPTLAGSTVIYTFSEGGFAVTYDWNDGNPVWEYGFTQAGNAVFNALNAYKIQGNYIEAGAITADKITLTANERFDGGNTLADIIGEVTDELKQSVETIRRHIKMGYLDEDSTQYGIEIGETINDTFLSYARLQANRLSFYDNGTEVAYISNQKLYITNAEITNSLTINHYVFDTSHGGIALMWQGG